MKCNKNSQLRHWTLPTALAWGLLSWESKEESKSGKGRRVWREIFLNFQQERIWSLLNSVRSEDTKHFPSQFLFLSSSLSPPQPPDTSFRGPASLPSSPAAAGGHHGNVEDMTVRESCKTGLQFTLYTQLTRRDSREKSQVHWCKTFTNSNYFLPQS